MTREDRAAEMEVARKLLSGVGDITYQLAAGNRAHARELAEACEVVLGELLASLDRS